MRIQKEFLKILKKEKHLAEYRDLHVQSDTLYTKYDPAKFLSVPGLVWEAALKNTKVNLDILTDISMLLMVEKGLTGGVCHSIYRYAKANNKYMKDYDENKESSYLQYWDANNLQSWAMSQKRPVNNFERTKDTSKFNEDFIQNYNEESDEGCFSEVHVIDFQYLDKSHELHNDLPFLPKKS